MLDDRRDVWDERDRHRVFVAPAYKPLVAPEDEVIYCILILLYFDLCRSYLNKSKMLHAMSAKYSLSPYTIYEIILYSPSSKYCLCFCVSYIFNKRVMLLWVWWDATEKYKWTNVWKWGIWSSKQRGCWWLFIVQVTLCYIYIVWSMPNIQKIYITCNYIQE